MEEKYANVIVDISHEKVDRPFAYKVPDTLKGQLEAGMKVIVPFGRGNKRIEGYIMELTDDSEYPPEKLKEIETVVQGGIPIEGEQIRLAAWLKHSYGSTMIAAMKTVLPVKQKIKSIEKRTVSLFVPKDEGNMLLQEWESKHQVAKVRFMRRILAEKSLPYQMAVRECGVSPKTLTALCEKGIISIQKTSSYRNPIKIEQKEECERVLLSEEQNKIVTCFEKDRKDCIPIRYLIHGITGSGKTEVYMAMIEQVLQAGEQAIVLIPEIALTYQTVHRFYERFGSQVSIVNSRLSMGERYDQFERAKKGEVNIMIGPRTALFTPFLKLGLIIIDEEHEGSYKSDTMPRFHAREVAEQIANMTGAAFVLGSATPSLDAYYKTQSGKYQLFQLKKRLMGARLPTVYTVDLREELRQGNRSIFSRILQEKVNTCLLEGKQIMLFLNRRGYAGFLSCRSCGYVVKCPHCDISLTKHKNGMLVCHYCGYEQKGMSLCPECGSKYLLGFKAGTEQVEEQVKKVFPKARVLRMDKDTTRCKDDYETILTRFSEGKADILIGTQMIVKGHDFKNVTLVGVLAADLSLGANDYRAAERTFQLVTQAAGRAGRGRLLGEVVIQTYQPEHYSIIHAANQDYEGFYEEEMNFRLLAGYPPISHMLGIFIQDKKWEKADEVSKLLSHKLRTQFQSERMSVIGPAKGSIEKINDVYRYVIYVKHKDYESLIRAKDFIESFMNQEEEQRKSVTITFDFDPVNGY